jgi:hypothetical protein
MKLVLGISWYMHLKVPNVRCEECKKSAPLLDEVVLSQIEQLCRHGSAAVTPKILVRRTIAVSADAADHYGRLSSCMPAIQVSRFWQENYTATLLSFLEEMRFWAKSVSTDEGGPLQLVEKTFRFLQVCSHRSCRNSFRQLRSYCPRGLQHVREAFSM